MHDPVAENPVKAQPLSASVEGQSVDRLIRQPHGGALLADPRHQAPRTGHPPSPVQTIRDRMRQGLMDMLPQLFDDVQKGKIGKLQFAEFLAKYGIGATGSVTVVSPDVVKRLEQQAMLIASRPQWDSAELLRELRDVWV